MCRAVRVCRPPAVDATTQPHDASYVPFAGAPGSVCSHEVCSPSFRWRDVRWSHSKVGVVSAPRHAYEGWGDGAGNGAFVGLLVGMYDGCGDGAFIGDAVGRDVGMYVGTLLLGTDVGVCVNIT